MQKLKFCLDYHCYPIWIYNEKGEIVDNDLPEELSEVKEIDETLVKIQNVYDSLFIDNPIEFKYVGFKNESDRRIFIEMINDVMKLIESKVGNLYFVEKKIDDDLLQ